MSFSAQLIPETTHREPTLLTVVVHVYVADAIVL